MYSQVIRIASSCTLGVIRYMIPMCYPEEWKGISPVLLNLFRLILSNSSFSSSFIKMNYMLAVYNTLLLYMYNNMFIKSLCLPMYVRNS